MKKDSSNSLVVLVPGMFSLGGVFSKLKGVLERLGRRVRVIDFPMNMGADNCSYEGLCWTDFWDKINHLKRILKSLNGPFVLVGHSAGALLVLRVAMENDINPERIFLIAPAATRRVFGLYPSVIWSFFFVLKVWNFHKKSFWISYDQFRWAMANTLSDNQASEVYRQLRPEFGGFISQIGLPWVDFSEATKIDFSQIMCPIEIIVGSKDRVTPPGISWQIKEQAEIMREETEAEDYLVRCTELKGFCHWLPESMFLELACWIINPDSLDKGTGL